MFFRQISRGAAPPLRPSAELEDIDDMQGSRRPRTDGQFTWSLSTFHPFVGPPELTEDPYRRSYRLLQKPLAGRGVLVRGTPVWWTGSQRKNSMPLLLAGDERTCWVSLSSGFRVPPELLKDAPSHHTFSGVEPKHASCDFTNQAERFDYRASKPEMVVPPVHPGIE
jgi:hypothetical protein